MGNCKRCGAENVDSSVFCGTCGADLRRKCARCNTIVDDNAKSCNNCGMPMDGSVPCLRCGAPHKKQIMFCTICGKSFAPRIIQIISAWILTGIMAMMFAFSFLPVMKVQVNLKELINDASMPNTYLNFNVSGAQMIAAAFYTIDPKSAEDVMTEFALTIDLEDIISGELPEGNITGTKMLKKIEKAINKFGVMKLLLTKDGIQSNSQFAGIDKEPNLVAKAWIGAVLMIGYMVGTLIAFIFMLLNAIKMTMYKGIKPFKYSGLLMGAMAGLILLTGLSGMLHIGAGVFVIISLAAAGCIYSGIMNSLAKPKEFSLKRTISQGVSAVVAFIMIFMMLGTAYSYDEGKNNFKFDAYDQSQGMNVAGNEFYKALEEQSLTEMLGAGGAIKSYILPAALFSFAETSEFSALRMVVGLGTFFAFLITAVGISGVLAYSLADFSNGRKRKLSLLWYLLAVGGAFIGLIFTIVNLASSVAIFSQLKLAGKFTIGALPILMLIFAAGMLVQFLILNAKKKEKPLLDYTNGGYQSKYAQYNKQNQTGGYYQPQGSNPNGQQGGYYQPSEPQGSNPNGSQGGYYQQAVPQYSNPYSTQVVPQSYAQTSQPKEDYKQSDIETIQPKEDIKKEDDQELL